MRVSNELPILEGENKGYLINTVDMQGLKYHKLLREEKQLCVRVCKLTWGSIIEGSSQEVCVFDRNASCAATKLGSCHTYPGIPPDTCLGLVAGNPLLQNGI